MNVIYMHTHDSGRYLQPYGYNVPTPNLLGFAKESVLFRHAYCAGPTCSPSRAALLTGTSPHSSGMIGLAHRGFRLSDPGRHLSHFLAERGYETVLCGIQHEGKIEELGYKKHLVPDNNQPGKNMVNRDINNAKMVADYLSEQKDTPFFLAFGMFSTHRPYPKNNGRIDPGFIMPPANLYDTKEIREDMAEYCLSAKIADDCVGIVLDAVKANNLEEDTLIFFTTDHGIAFPNMKCNLYDTGIGVSLIIRMPGKNSASFQTDALVSHVDVFPTICELLNLEKPDYLEGRSLVPVLTGETEKIRDEIFSEVTYHAAYQPMRCVRTDRYKLIRFYDSYDKTVLANIDDGYSKTFLLENGLQEKRRKENTMLFDLYFDPAERVNLVHDPEYKTVLDDLNRRLDVHMISTNDPILNGKPPKPDSAIVNSLNCISPTEKVYE